MNGALLSESNIYIEVCRTLFRDFSIDLTSYCSRGNSILLDHLNYEDIVTCFANKDINGMCLSIVNGWSGDKLNIADVLNNGIQANCYFSCHG